MPESSREFRPDLAREFEYLLGHMPRVDRETFQGLLIENSEMSERVLEAENELFDAYVRGELPGEWRPAFEERLLASAAGKRKLIIARKLQDRTRRVKRTWWLASAIAAGIALAAGLWPSITGQRGSPEQRPAPVQAARQIQTLPLAAVTRGAGPRPSFTVEANITHLELALPADPPASVELSTLDGKQLIWKSSGAPPPFQAPAALLPAGTYLLTSFDSAQRPFNYYEFEIVRK